MMKDWRERARARMQALGLTQQDLARALGCTRGAVGHYLAGRRTPSLAQLVALARELGVSPAWLQYGVGPVEPPDPMTEPERDPGVAVRVPVTGDTRRGPRGGRSGWLAVPAGAYALVVSGAELAPRARAGELLLLDPAARPARGDEVLVRFRNGVLGLRQFIAAEGGRMTFADPEGGAPDFVLQTDIEFVHVVVAVFRSAASRR